MPYFEMSLLAIKSALKKAATRLYPFVVRPDIPKTRGRIDMHIDFCTFCTLCARKCPTNAIEIDRKSSPRVFKLDRFRCILCGACVEDCLTKKSIYIDNHYAPPVLKREVIIWTQATPPPKAAAPVTSAKPV